MMTETITITATSVDGNLAIDIRSEDVDGQPLPKNEVLSILFMILASETNDYLMYRRRIRDRNLPG